MLAKIRDFKLSMYEKKVLSLPMATLLSGLSALQLTLSTKVEFCHIQNNLTETLEVEK